MIILDFLFYYLTYWFDKNKQKLAWSTPLERTIYAVGLMSGTLILALDQFLEFKYPYLFTVLIPKWIFIILVLLIMQLYKYIYIIRNRYQFVVSKNSLKIDKDIGAYICIGMLILSFLAPFIVIMITIPFGVNRHH